MIPIVLSVGADITVAVTVEVPIDNGEVEVDPVVESPVITVELDDGLAADVDFVDVVNVEAALENC